MNQEPGTRIKTKEQGTKSQEQEARQKNKEQRARNKEQRQKTKDLKTLDCLGSLIKFNTTARIIS